MMYCPECGAKNLDDAKFCTVCGAPIPKLQPKRQINSFTEAVAMAMSGNDRGFSWLYEQTYKSKFYLAKKYMDDEDAAEDVMQDSYVKAFSKLDTLKDPETFPAWFGTIVANTAKNALKKKNPISFTDVATGDEELDDLELQIEDESIDSQPEEAYTRQETAELVQEMISSLSEEQKICVLMYYIDGESVHDIAEALECSENTVRSRLNYGKKNLKTKAEQLQKKGYKLFTLAPIPLLLGLIRKDAYAMSAEQSFLTAGSNVENAVMQSLHSAAGGGAQAGAQAGAQTGAQAGAQSAGAGSGAAANTGAQAAGAGAQTAAGVGTHTSATVGTQVAAGAAQHGFLATTAGKVVLTVVIAGAAAGGIGGGVAAVNHSNQVNEEAVEEAVADADEDIVVEPSEELGEADGEGSPESPEQSEEPEGSGVQETVQVGNPPNEESVLEELEQFKYMADLMLVNWYSTDEFYHDESLSAFETIGPAQAYSIAGRILIDGGFYGNTNDNTYRYVDGEIISYDELSGDQLSRVQGSYILLPTDMLEEYVIDLFGEDCITENLGSYPDEYNGWELKTDSNGRMYALLGEYGDQNVDVSIESISDTPDENGSYAVLVKYTDYISENKDEDEATNYYMLYRFMPDEDSQYGYVISGMTPAGVDTPDPEIVAEITPTVAYSWVVEPTIEADDINYVYMDYNCAEYPAEYSLNESYRQLYSKSAVIERNGYYGLIGLDGELETDVIYDDITDAGDFLQDGDTGFFLTGGDVEWSGTDGDAVENNSYNDVTGEREYGSDGGGAYSKQYFYYDNGVLQNAVDSIYEANIPSDPIPVKQTLADGKYGYYLDLTGPFAVYYNGAPATDFIYDECGSYSSGLMAVSQEGKWGYINESGEAVIPIEYDPSWVLTYSPNIGITEEVDFCYAATDGYVALTKDGEWELRDTDGNLVIAPGEFEEIRPVYDGQCWVKEDGKWGVIQLEDSEGESATEAENGEWRQLYADYIEKNHINENAGEYRNYELVFINDDDVPEIFCEGTYNEAGNPILYIQDGEVKRYDGNVRYGDFLYTQRNGYIYYFEAHSGAETNTLAYLDENNELTMISEIASSRDSYWVNDVQVSQSEYEDEIEKIESRIPHGSYDWEHSGITLASNSEEAVTTLRADSASAEGNETSQNSGSGAGSKLTNITASASSQLENYQDKTYGPYNLFDGDIATAYVEGVSGVGVGQEVNITLDGEYVIDGITWDPGYQASSDLLAKNGYPTRLTFYFSDGTSVTSTLSGSVAVGTSVKVDIPDGTVASSIRVVIDEAVAGSDYEDTCISEIEIYGHNVE